MGGIEAWTRSIGLRARRLGAWRRAYGTVAVDACCLPEPAGADRLCLVRKRPDALGAAACACDRRISGKTWPCHLEGVSTRIGVVGVSAVLARPEEAGVPMLTHRQGGRRRRSESCTIGGRSRKVCRASFSSYSDAALMMPRKLSALRLAPPTRAPSTSGWAINSAALVGLTLPPYRMRIWSATNAG